MAQQYPDTYYTVTLRGGKSWNVPGNTPEEAKELLLNLLKLNGFNATPDWIVGCFQSRHKTQKK